MTDAEKVKHMAKALNDLNKIIYANTIIVGSDDYRIVRTLIVNTLRNVDEEVK